MEYEILDEPQGLDYRDCAKRDGGIAEDHIALRNQSSIAPGDYPAQDPKDGALFRFTTAN
ncbi:hypothetical protein [Qipengyuania marisflavi]|uniref:Uncharacterized protein n=1 Tax=Qipengyuania marisflavi TaxID=2486356 RepID=A0A5S3P903_9SPHN|nr:hypothetical protein [Qipengyuania marisflavi]TMM49918.1 hypothetical protein FEV51_01585 [Qipengyuania marisflavi]